MVSNGRNVSTIKLLSLTKTVVVTCFANNTDKPISINITITVNKTDHESGNTITSLLYVLNTCISSAFRWKSCEI